MQLLDPLHFLSISALYGIITIFRLILHLQFSTLLSISSFKDAWFANFWRAYGMRENTIRRVQPLIAQARGIVLEIGPGSGEWVQLYDGKRVTKIYGLEPNKDHHALLRRRIKEAGLENIYEIVPVGVEDIGKFGIEDGSIDSVVTIQCLCSVTRPEGMIGELYGYIKPGGQWIVYEHVKTHHEGFMTRYQDTIDIIWPHFLGGCSITRDTEKWLLAAGDWGSISLKQPEVETKYQVIPHVLGVLVK